MKKNIIFIILLIFTTLNDLFAQQSLQARNIFTKRTKFNFSSEWQYLSSDLYLFNETKFDILINNFSELLDKKNKKNPEVIENVLMTINIKDTKFGQNLVYPIFNFQVIQDKKTNKVIVKSNEVIRIIDNLPLTSTKDYIDADIEITAITNKSVTWIYSMVANQLKTISTLLNPSIAVQSLVGEFGQLLETKTQGKEYSFKSTIRIYEEHGFNKKLFSANIYVFAPSTERALVDTLKISKLLDSLDNPNLNKNKLYELIKPASTKYPFIVILNYKSKYQTDPVIGDEMTFEMIDKRKQKFEKAFQDGLINKDTYFQEKKLAEYLNIFAQIKLDLDNFQLNYKNKITNDFSKSYFVIMQNYKSLKLIFKNRLEEFNKNSAFQAEFRGQYENILNYAKLYLDKNNLANIKEFVDVIFEYETNTNVVLDSAKRENYLIKLYSLEIPSSENQTEDGKKVISIINQIENQHFSELFKRQIDKFNLLPANDSTKIISESLINRFRATNCKLCMLEVNKTIDAFNEKYKIYKQNKLVKQFEETKTKVKDKLFYILQKESLIDNYFSTKYKDTIPAHIQLIKDDFFNCVGFRKELQKLLDKEIPKDNSEKINETITEINNLLLKIIEIQKNICEKIPAACKSE